MATVTLRGSPVTTHGDLPAVGSHAPAFLLTGAGLEDITLDSLHGSKVLLNIFPSIDTPVCAASARMFDKTVTDQHGSVVLCVSRDLPFASARFCEAEDLERIVPASDFRTGAFGRDYGVTIMDGMFAGLLARAVVILDEAGRVLYTQLVGEIAEEPDYSAALDVLG